MSRLRVLLLCLAAAVVATADVEFTHHNNTMMASVLQQVEVLLLQRVHPTTIVGTKQQ
jgi:hypothetical protein